MTQKFSKKYYRDLFLQRRQKLSNSEIESLSLAISERCLTVLNGIDSVHIFIPIPNSKEINTWPIIRHCWQKKIKTTTSITKPEGQLAHSIFNEESKFAPGLFNTPTPYPIVKSNINQIQIVFVPLLVSDLRGNRVGYGGGYYDRFLCKLPKTTLKIGLSFFQPENMKDIFDEHDIQLNQLITPTESYNFY